MDLNKSATIRILNALKRKALTSLVLSICIYSAPAHSTDRHAVSMSHGNYMVKTEIVLPHLENNLQYTTTHTQQCLGQQNASTLFPILNHESFVGCTLVGKQEGGENREFDLVCSNPEAATGLVLFVIDKESFRANLSIKMGGKNMKFSQRVSGRRIGAC